METLSPTYAKRIKDSIEEITFEDYVNVVLGDFSSIAIAEDITLEECESTRTVLMAEFAEATGDYDYLTSTASQYKLMRLSLKQMGMILAHSILSASYDADIFDFLKKQRVIPADIPYPSTQDELDNVLKQIHVEVEFLNIEIAENTPKIPEKEKTDEKVTRRPFIRLLASVSQYVKFNVTFDTNCAVVAEYVSRLRQYQQEQENKKTTNKR